MTYSQNTIQTEIRSGQAIREIPDFSMVGVHSISEDVDRNFFVIDIFNYTKDFDPEAISYSGCDNAFIHWQSIQETVEVLNKLKTSRAHLTKCIIANEKLQRMCSRIHF